MDWVLWVCLSVLLGGGFVGFDSKFFDPLWRKFGSRLVGRLIRLLGNVRAARLSKRLRMIGGPHTSIDSSILLVDLDL